ncbi:ribosomal RNA small subunit methyltransferase A, partial [Singulisphaera rosea]
PAMARLTSEAVEGRPNVRVLNIDALANKNTLNPQVLDTVRSGLAIGPEKRLKLVANLPYNIATPIISNLPVHPEFCPTAMVVTIQLELADRMRAEPATDAYGALSVLLSALSDVTLVRTLPPSVFWPRPKVDSAVISIIPDPAKRATIGDVEWFHKVVRQVFLHRRKNLRRVLYSLWRGRWTKPEVDAMLEGLGLTGLIRAETMNVEEFLSLATAIKERLGDNPDRDAPDVDEDVGEDEDQDQEEEPSEVEE